MEGCSLVLSLIEVLFDYKGLVIILLSRRSSRSLKTGLFEDRVVVCKEISPCLERRVCVCAGQETFQIHCINVVISIE